MFALIEGAVKFNSTSVPCTARYSQILDFNECRLLAMFGVTVYLVTKNFKIS